MRFPEVETNPAAWDQAARELRGLAYLVRLTFLRQAAGKKALVSLVLVVVVSLIAILWARRNNLPAEATDAERTAVLQKFTTQLVLPVYVSFLLPILSAAYAAGAIADDREERTLVHLLIRPLSRSRVYLAKGLGILPLTIGIGLGGFAMVSLSAGSTGRVALSHYWPAILWGSIAYSSLFLAFGGLLPRPIVLSVAYAFLIETLLGNAPGTIKRGAISFHIQCIVFAGGEPLGVRPDSESRFVPIDGQTATLVLWTSSAVLLLFGAWLFSRREFHDLD